MNYFLQITSRPNYPLILDESQNPHISSKLGSDLNLGNYIHEYISSPLVYRDAENLPQSFISDEDYAKYDTAFFKDHALIYLKLAEPSGSITETVKSVTVDESGTWHITVESRIPDNQTADMMAWVHYIAVPSTLPDDVKIVVDRVKTDADGNQLPQTGYSNFYKTIVELAALMVAGGVILVVKSKKESK